jgi:hypothetical protein
VPAAKIEIRYIGSVKQERSEQKAGETGVDALIQLAESYQKGLSGMPARTADQR